MCALCALIYQTTLPKDYPYIAGDAGLEHGHICPTFSASKTKVFGSPVAEAPLDAWRQSWLGEW